MQLLTNAAASFVASFVGAFIVARCLRAMERRKPRTLEDKIRAQLGKGGVAAIVGRWPGDETDEEIEQALRKSG